jgi:uncharacterized membrane protein
MWFLFSSLLLLLWIAMPIWALAIARHNRRELERLRERVHRLESERGAALSAVPPPGEAAEPAPGPEPLPFPGAVAARPPEPAIAPVPPRFFDGARLEDLVGGLWFQNVGAVLVLLGAFFLILWGYTTGRLGPGALVAAGVAVGLALAWRGDRVARRLPPFGHALMGVGFGVAYLSVALGHFTLRALPAGAALALLAAVALVTVLAGLRHRAQAIAVLGVLGAFLPLLLPHLFGIRGFDLTNGQSVAWMAAADAAVFALALRPGWGALGLTALLLTLGGWAMVFDPGPWTWGQQAALTAMTALFGLAPLPRLAGEQTRVSAVDVATLTLAPALYAAVSWPFLAWAGRPAAALLLLGAAAVWMAAAWWVEPRRASGELWRPLVAGSTLFVTVAIERLAGLEWTATAWIAEGLALAWLGAGRRGAWLRGLGAVVSALGACTLFARVAVDGHCADAGALPILHGDALRDLAGVLLLFATGAVLERESRFPAPWPRLLSRAWVLGANLVLLAWGAREANHLARALEASGGRWARPPALGAPLAARRIETLAAFTATALWTLQALAMFAAGWWRGSAFLRWLGLGLLALCVLKFAFGDLATVDAFWRFVTAVAVGVVLLAVSYAYQRRIRRERASGSGG